MADSDFNTWLRVCLDEVGLDGDVFADYISGTLQDMTDTSRNEKMESLRDLLSGALVRHGENNYCLIVRVIRIMLFVYRRIVSNCVRPLLMSGPNIITVTRLLMIIILPANNYCLFKVNNVHTRDGVILMKIGIILRFYIYLR